MIKHFFVGLCLLGLLSSCSSDDDSTNPVTQQELVQLKTTRFSYMPIDPFDPNSETVTIIGQIDVTDFVDGKPSTSSYYTSAGTNLNSQDVYQYNEQGLLATRTMHYFAASEDYITNYSYDNQGRLTEITQVNPTANPYSVTTFTYNPDNTITELRTITSSNDETLTTYYLNDSGMIYKEESEGITVNYNLNGFDTMGLTIQAPNFSQFINYTYDTEHDPSLLNLQHMTGDYIPNLRLVRGYIYYTSETETVITTKYLTQFNRGGYDIIDFDYTFNENGLPTLKKAYHAGTHTTDYEYFYE